MSIKLTDEQIEKSKNITNMDFKRITKIVGNVVFGIMVLMVALLVFFLIQTKVSGGPPAIAGYRMYIVLSGSMAPAFDTGSLAFVKPMKPEQIKEGDIITFRGFGEHQSLTSHRVVEVDDSTSNDIKFITKGDANEVNDPSPVPGTNLVGKVAIAIPYMGYVMSFVQTKQGQLILVIIPAALLIISEIRKLYINIMKMNKEKRSEEKLENEV
ncbi:MAG: signal peptidase I [Bacillota bacterium]